MSTRIASTVASMMASFVGALTLLILGGCSGASATATVSGNVTFKGQPLTAGRVAFLSEDGRVDFAVIKDGKYSTSQAPIGKIKVSIEPPGEGSLMAANPKANRLKGMMNRGKEEGYNIDTTPQKDKKAPKVPLKYLDPDKSGLSFDVKANEKKTFDIEIP